MMLHSTFDISLPTPVMAGVRTPQRQFSSCVLIETDDSWIVLMLLLALLLSMLAKKQVLASELVESAPSEVIYVAEIWYHTGVIPFYKCFRAQLDPAAKVKYETERRRYTILLAFRG